MIKEISNLQLKDYINKDDEELILKILINDNINNKIEVLNFLFNYPEKENNNYSIFSNKEIINQTINEIAKQTKSVDFLNFLNEEQLINILNNDLMDCLKNVKPIPLFFVNAVHKKFLKHNFNAYIIFDYLNIEQKKEYISIQPNILSDKEIDYQIIKEIFNKSKPKNKNIILSIMLKKDNLNNDMIDFLKEYYYIKINNYLDSINKDKSKLSGSKEEIKKCFFALQNINKKYNKLFILTDIYLNNKDLYKKLQDTPLFRTQLSVDSYFVNNPNNRLYICSYVGYLITDLFDDYFKNNKATKTDEFVMLESLKGQINFFDNKKTTLSPIEMLGSSVNLEKNIIILLRLLKYNNNLINEFTIKEKEYFLANIGETYLNVCKKINKSLSINQSDKLYINTRQQNEEIKRELENFIINFSLKDIKFIEKLKFKNNGFLNTILEKKILEKSMSIKKDDIKNKKESLKI